MCKSVTIVCFLISVIQTAQSQLNLAALLGLGGLGGLPESQTSGSGSCPYQTHQDRTKFSQMVNNRLLTQDCAPGTMFVLSKCSCDNIPTGSPGGGHMPGSNPRLNFGGDHMLNALLGQLQGAAFPSPPTRAPPPPIRNRSPMNSNQLNAMRQQVTSGVRPDQTRRGNTATKTRKSQSAPSNGMQYNPDPGTGLTSVVDPSVLPDVLPPEILKVLRNSNNNPGHKPTAAAKAPTGESNLPASVQKMLNRAAKPPTRRKSPPSNKSQSNNFVGMALPPGAMPPDVMKMLQNSIQPPPKANRRGNSNRVNSKSQRLPVSAPRSNQNVNQSPRRSQSSTRQSGSRQDPLASLMAQMQGKRDQHTGPKPSRSPPSGPRQDPLAALLAGVSHQNRGQNRGPSRSQNRGPTQAPQRGPPRGSGGPPGGDPFAALLAGMGGGPGSSRGGNDPFAALMAGIGGGSGQSPGGQSGGNDALAALMSGMGGSNPGGVGTPGDALSMSLGRNVDMTNYFNAHGLPSGGTQAALAGLQNINYLKLQQLDRQGVIDIGDLSPAGLLAANAHFAG